VKTPLPITNCQLTCSERIACDCFRPLHFLCCCFLHVLSQLAVSSICLLAAAPFNCQPRNSIAKLNATQSPQRAVSSPTTSLLQRPSISRFVSPKPPQRPGRLRCPVLDALHPRESPSPTFFGARLGGTGTVRLVGGQQGRTAPPSTQKAHAGRRDELGIAPVAKGGWALLGPQPSTPVSSLSAGSVDGCSSVLGWQTGCWREIHHGQVTDRAGAGAPIVGGARPTCKHASLTNRLLCPGELIIDMYKRTGPVLRCNLATARHRRGM